ncbi:MAG: hypothetical protein JW818_23420 [Pirellulales bacterium]|nr:hypothetical protein [Pirellulales bacterium]
MKDKGNSGFWRVVAKVTQERDQSIALVRDEYMRLDATNRHRFREWVDMIASAGGFPVGIGANVSVQIHVDAQSGPNEPEMVSVSPRTLSRAFASWDRGEEYVHSAAEF